MIKYEKPQIRIISFTEDVIRASEQGTVDDNYDWLEDEAGLGY